MTASRAQVALVNMPFAPVEHASIQLGILHALLARRGIACQDFYANLDFFAYLSRHNLQSLYASTSPALVLEWLFSPQAFAPASNVLDFTAALKLEAYARSTGRQFSQLLEIKNVIVPEFLEFLLQAHDWARYRIAAFTLSYPQIMAAFRFAQLLKASFPDLITVFGGSYSQIHEASVPEFMRCYPFIDVMVVGEAEPVFATLTSRLLQGREIAALPGVACRQGEHITYHNGVSRLESFRSPLRPDYRAFFERRSESALAAGPSPAPAIPMEFTRGCIWSHKRPCVFCSFSPHQKWLSKTTAHLLSETRQQSRDYNCHSFYLVDTSLTPAHLRTTLPALKKQDPDFRLAFVEMRTDAGEDALELLAECGTQIIQPGIEALDDGILALMGKGVTLLQNLRFMLKARALGLRLSYNLILGTPGESAASLQKQIALIKLIPHLEPPFPMQLAFTRFSGYQRPSPEYQFLQLTPDKFYRLLYPPEMDVAKTAFHYQTDYHDTALFPWYQETLRLIAAWRERWLSFEPPGLQVKFAAAGMTVTDSRTAGAPPVTQVFEAGAAEVYRQLCATPSSPDELQTLTGKNSGELAAMVEDFKAKGLLWLCSHKYVALALPSGKK